VGTQEADRLVDELSRSIDGDPWHGSSVSAILRGVTAAAAGSRAFPGVHTIWEIVRHMTAWTAEANRRVQGHPPAEPLEGDWPASTGAGEEGWRRDVAALIDTHRALVERVRTLSDATLFAAPAEHRDAPTGSGVSLDVLLHGVAQHHAYHAGQIAILKKVLASR
jgi:hypothetical protein